eukprot:scaffold95399_cov31-Tisochrysis_lutea.AAC.5
MVWSWGARARILHERLGSRSKALERTLPPMLHYEESGSSSGAARPIQAIVADVVRALAQADTACMCALREPVPRLQARTSHLHLATVRPP